jgi:uncharacterized protein
MPEYLSPAVYVEEVDTGAKPIEGVSTSTAGLVGVTERGPVHVPILVTSFGEYQRIFGGLLNENDYLQPHNYLPHAVDGFFRNGGQRAFVVRVLDTAGAARASALLFDRGAATSAETVLLRAAAAATGPAGTALPYVLDNTNLNANDWIRIGGGSAAEYRQVVALGTDESVALDLPLRRSHAAGAAVDEIARAAVGAYANPLDFTLDQLAEAGAEVIRVTGDAANVANLVARASAANGELVEIGPSTGAEYRWAIAATQLAPGLAEVRLDTALALAHDAATAVTPLDTAAAPAASNALETGAAAGSGLLFLNALGGSFNLRTQLVVIDPGNNALREVRRIGRLGVIDIATGAYETYRRDLSVRVVQSNDRTEVGAPPRSLTAIAAINANTIDLDDVTGLETEHALRITDGVDRDDVFITQITAGVAPAGTVTFAPRLTHGYAVGDAARRIFAFRLTQAANAGQFLLASARRADLAEGQVLRIGNAPNDEYLRIDDLPNRNPAGPPDAGNVVLEHPLGRSHALDTICYSQTDPVPAALQPTALALEAQAGATTLAVLDGDAYAANALVELRSPFGEVHYHRLAANFTPAANASRLELSNPPLRRAQAVGSLVLGRAPLLDIEAIDAGLWGNRLRVAIVDEPQGLVQGTRLQQIHVTSATVIRLDSSLGVETGTVLEFSQNGAVVGNLQKVDLVDRRTGQITLQLPGLDAAQTAALAVAPLQVRSREFCLRVFLLRQIDAAVPTRNETVLDSEQFRHLSMDPRHSRYVETVVGDIDGELRRWDRRPRGESAYIRTRDQVPSELVRLGPEPLVDTLPSGRVEPARRALEDIAGFDSIGTLTHNEYIGVDAAEEEHRTGIFALRNYEDISLVACPGQIDANIQRALIEHCETLRFRFAVLDGPAPANDTLADARAQRQLFDTKYAAMYHPWLLISDPFPTNPADVRDYPIPPSGHVTGVYARTDIERGVHKAPANEVLRGVIGLRRQLNKQEHDILNPSPVNISVIRDFRPNNRGIRVWGARVITSDNDWKYVNVRRLLIFIEHSIERGLQWVVFEPNADPLWARVRRTIANFLTVVWRNGALEGTTIEEAFFVKCDRTTMTQTDIDNGRLICEVGVAPVKPAEFVIIRIGLWTAHAETE